MQRRASQASARTSQRESTLFHRFRVFLTFFFLAFFSEKKEKWEKNSRTVKKPSDFSFFSPKNASFSVKRKKNARSWKKRCVHGRAFTLDVVSNFGTAGHGSLFFLEAMDRFF